MDKPWTARYDPGVPATLQYPAVRVFDLLAESALKWPEHSALIFNDRRITYRELARLVDQLAQGLLRWGLKKGERVSLLLPNCPQFVAAYYAILKAGGIVAAINPHSAPAELEFQIREAGSVLLIAAEESRVSLANAGAGWGLRGIVWTALEEGERLGEWLQAPGPAANLAGAAQLRLENLLWSGCEDAEDWPEVSPEDAAVFQFSGGTTGIPKAAVGLHRNLCANSLQFRRWLSGLRDGAETALLVIPLYHVYGMVVGMNVGCLLGAEMVLAADARNLVALLEWIQKYRVSFLPGAPTLYALLNQYPDVRNGKYDLRSIRACISGSAPLPEAVRIEFERLSGAKLMEGYGLSEAPTATHCNPMLGEKRAGSIGLPLPDVECKLVSLEDDAVEVGVGEPGELLVRGPQVMQGYYRRENESAAALRGGWLHTGDVARMDGDGYFFIVDRLKDMLKVSGFQVWPREVEEVITGHPAVLDAGAAGIPHPTRGEAVKAWVIIRPGSAVEAGELIEWCKARLIYYKVPVAIEFVKALPRSGVGKLLRRMLKNKP